MSAANYPPGTWEGDPRAPWNAPDLPECPGHGEMEWNEGKERWVCGPCEAIAEAAEAELDAHFEAYEAAA